MQAQRWQRKRKATERQRLLSSAQLSFDRKEERGFFAYSDDDEFDDVGFWYEFLWWG